MAAFGVIELDWPIKPRGCPGVIVIENNVSGAPQDFPDGCRKVPDCHVWVFIQAGDITIGRPWSDLNNQAAQHGVVALVADHSDQHMRF